PKVFDLLVYLVRHRERMVGKDELLDVLWEGRAVSDSVMARAIHGARRLVGDPAVIKTFYGRGYRFVGAVSMRDGESPQDRAGLGSRPATTAASPQSRGRILVGRTTEIALAHECLTAALDGSTRTLTITGEAGIGKTAVCEQIGGLAEGRGVRPLWGRC